MSRSKRRMIFPERVLGSVSVKRISAGRAMAPISLLTCARSVFSNSSSTLVPPSGLTKATIAVPVMSSGRPTTADSATSGCETRALSTSIVPMRCPEMFITSSIRPMIQK